MWCAPTRTSPVEQLQPQAPPPLSPKWYAPQRRSQGVQRQPPALLPWQTWCEPRRTIQPEQVPQQWQKWPLLQRTSLQAQALPLLLQKSCGPQRRSQGVQLLRALQPSRSWCGLRRTSQQARAQPLWPLWRVSRRTNPLGRHLRLRWWPEQQNTTLSWQVRLMRWHGARSKRTWRLQWLASPLPLLRVALHTMMWKQCPPWLLAWQRQPLQQQDAQQRQSLRPDEQLRRSRPLDVRRSPWHERVDARWVERSESAGPPCPCRPSPKR